MQLIILTVIAAILYFRIGDHDYGAGFVTAGLSIIVSLITWFVFGWGPYGFLGGQILFFVGLTWYNIQRHERQQRRYASDRPVSTSYPEADRHDPE